MGKRNLLDEYRHPGCRPKAEIRGVFGDPYARVIRLERTQKKQSAEYATRRTEVITTRKLGWFGTCRAEKFNPVLTDLEIPKKTNLPKAIVSYCREIAESDGIVIVRSSA